MSAKPLEGHLVVDLTRYLPGPWAAQTLAALGARVIKVEEPELGDPLRLAPPRVGDIGALGAPVLTGLESLALDLKKPAGQAVLERLLARADILLETFRPGVLEAFGFAPQKLRERFPALVICSLSGWGQTGPLASRTGHDLTYQAVAGSLAATAAVPSLPSADFMGSWSCVSSVLAALVERGRTGEGTWIDASLFDAALHANLVAWSAEVGGPQPVGEAHDLAGALPCYQVYRTADQGWVALALLEPKFWKRFCRALGRKDLMRLGLERSRDARRRVSEVMATRSREEWEAFFAEHDLPAAAVLSAAEASKHPQAVARGVVSFDSRGLPRVAFPARFDGERPASGDHLPELGEHTEALLTELGVSPRDLPRWKARAGVGKRLGLKRWLARLLIR